jgi:sRNA-binding protein
VLDHLTDTDEPQSIAQIVTGTGADKNAIDHRTQAGRHRPNGRSEMYDTYQDEFVKRRSFEELNLMLQHLVGKYPKAFAAEFFERQPLGANVLDELMQRENWTRDNAIAILKYYHSPWGFRMGFRAGINKIDLDGRANGKLTDEDARTVREEAKRQIDENKARKSAVSAPAAPRHNGLIPAPAATYAAASNPAVNIIQGVKALKEKLKLQSEQLADQLREIFPAELIELFPDLERSISKMMEGAEEVVKYCSEKKPSE